MTTDNFSELSAFMRLNLAYAEIGKSATQFVLAALPAKIGRLRSAPLTIATSYPQIARQSLLTRGYRLQAEMLVVNGSVEAAGDAVDAIVDVSITGDSLSANGYEIVERDLWAVAIGAITANTGGDKALQIQEKGMI